MSYSMSPMTSPSSSTKRVRFSPDVKDSDDMPSPSSSYSPMKLPKTPRRAYAGIDASIFPPSPPLSDSSIISDVEVFLHGLLLPRPGANASLVFDVRQNVSQAYIPSFPSTAALSSQLVMPATQPVMRRIQLIAPGLPWTIVVENPHGVTVGDVLYRLHESLHRKISKQDYDDVLEVDRTEILKAYQRNCLPNASNTRQRTLSDGMMRVDWLGKKTMFAGIRKDERFIAARVKDAFNRSETFVLEFTSV